MATVTAASVSSSDSVERFRQEFNTLRSDVSNIQSGSLTITNESNNRIFTSVSTNTFNAESGLTYDGSTFAVTGAVTVSGLTTLSSNLIIPNAGNIGSASDADAIAISSAGLVTLSQDLTMGHDGAVINFGGDSEIALTHNHNVGLKMTSTAYAPLARRGEDVFIVLDGTDASSADAGDNVIMDRSAADGTDVGDDIIGEDEVFLHSGMQRNVIEIRDSGGNLLNSVAGFAPGAI